MARVHSRYVVDSIYIQCYDSYPPLRLASFFIIWNCLKQSFVVILIVLSLKQLALLVLQESRVLGVKGAQLETKVSRVYQDSQAQLHSIKVCQTEAKH